MIEVTIPPDGETFSAKATRTSEHAERLSREERGLRLYEERGHDIQQIAKGVYSVPSCTGKGDYLVRYSGTAESCECDDHRRRGMTCKHQYAAALFAAKRRRAIRTRFLPVI